MLNKIRLLPLFLISSVLLGQNVVTNPTGNQNIVQPIGTQISTNNFSNIRYVTAANNWSATSTVNLATPGGGKTITLTPCPIGIDTTDNADSPFFVYIPTTNAEAALVTGGTCTSGATSGTIIVTTTVAHSATSNTVESAYAGIQEALNDACGLSSSGGNCHVIVTPSSQGQTIYAPVFEHSNRSLVEGDGVTLYTATRSRAWVLGYLPGLGPALGNITLRGLKFSSSITQDGCQITNTSRTSNIVTITVSSCSTIINGDTVNTNFTDNPSYWGTHGPVTVSGSLITYSQTGANIPSAATPGTIAIENAAVEDNALPGTIENFQLNSLGGGQFNQGIVADNDQAATYRNTDYSGNALLWTANHCGSYVYSAGNTSAAPVIWVDHPNWSMQCAGNGITNYANNGTHITGGVIQGFGMWGENVQNLLGSFGATESDDVYMEEGAGPCTSPYNPGSGTYFSAAGIIWYGNLQPLIVQGGEQPGAHIPQFTCTGCSGTTQLNYYVVAHDTTAGVYTFPLLAGNVLTNLASGTVTGQFPHIPPQAAGDTVTYDILRMEPQIIATNTPTFPVKGSCTGGSTTACGSVITGKAQCSGLVCTFTDNPSTGTSSYTINNNSWQPILPFWPAGILITGAGPGGFSTSPVIASSEPAGVVSVNGNGFAQVFVGQCAFADNDGTSGGVWKHCPESGTNGAGEAATVLDDSPPAGGVTQGRLNFTTGDPYGVFGVTPHHIITLINSIPNTTLATITNRPTASANDTFIGTDNSAAFSSAQLAFGSPVAISNYIGNVGTMPVIWND